MKLSTWTCPTLTRGCECQPAVFVVATLVVARWAGVDRLIIAGGIARQRESRDALLAALETGELSRDRLDEALRHVLTVRARFGLLGGAAPIGPGCSEVAIPERAPAPPAVPETAPAPAATPAPPAPPVTQPSSVPGRLPVAAPAPPPPVPPQVDPALLQGWRTVMGIKQTFDDGQPIGAWFQQVAAETGVQVRVGPLGGTWVPIPVAPRPLSSTKTWSRRTRARWRRSWHTS